jgi:molecular chaperone GrpE (heat shock protein)
MNASSSNSIPRGPVPGSNVPGAGTARGARLVQWKGRTLNMDAARVPESVEASEVSSTQDVVQNSEASAPPENLQAQLATLMNGMGEMCNGLQEIYSVVTRLSDRDTNNERVFNTLHAELSDYKKDFIYEHLKPVIRPLLFLYDSLEQFETEIGPFAPEVKVAHHELREGAMPSAMARQNTIYFREQLVEALRICEVTPMETPSGVFNPRFHKAIRAVPVADEQHNIIVEVLRSGWFLNGQLLRPAEVVVGKSNNR